MLIVLLNFILFGIAFYFFQGLLSNKIAAEQEAHNRIFTTSEIKVLKSLFLPFTGCMASIPLVLSLFAEFISCNDVVNDRFSYGILCVAFLAVLAVVGFFYAKAISKSIEDFSQNGQILITIIKSLCYGSTGLFVLTALFLLMLGFIPPLIKLTIIILGGALQLPTFKNMGGMISEMDRNLHNTDAKITVPNNKTQDNKPTKRCPCCGEEILAIAKKCKHCGEWLEEQSK